MPKNVAAIGIDLGTTNSCVGVVRNGRVEIIANDMGNRITPSFVAFTEAERLIGDAAKEQASWNPENTVFDVKRLIGRKFDDPDVQKMIELWPFTVVDCDNVPKITVTFKEEEKTFTPEEISAMVLMNMKEVAETFLGCEVTDAVITVPAYFNDSQRQATIDAGKISGLNVLSIITEPTAAAIAYSLERKNKKKRNILVFDLGGGTLDVVILKIDNDKFNVLAVNGDTFLGGGDLDNLLVKHFQAEFERKNNMDLSEDARALSKLKKACEKVKRNLSSSKKERIQIESLFNGIDFDSSISRVRFEELCSDLFKKTLNPVESVLRDAKMVKGEIDEIVLAGGSTRIPKIQDILEKCFSGKALNKTINPDESVAYGAAFHAAMLSGENSVDVILLQDVLPLSLGTEVLGNHVSRIIQRNTKLPVQKTKRYTTVIEDQDSVQVKVYEGERTKCAHNNLLGEFLLEDLEVAPSGVPKIDVTFSVDKNGILTVSALDISSGNLNSIVITSKKGRLNRDEIKQMMVEAQELKNNDQSHQEDIAARGDLESHCMDKKNDVDESLSAGDVTQEDADKIISACDEIIFWLDDYQEATKEECSEKQNALDELCSSILE